jgi:alpha,alpha-trehalase
MAGADALAPGSADKRAVRMADGALLNRYWDDNDTPRPESWLDDVKTAKSNPNRPATEIYRDLRSAAASGWDFSSRWMDNPQQLATIRTTIAGRSQCPDVPSGENPRPRQQAGDSAGAAQYDALANARQKAIEKYLWNDKEGWYADYDLKTHKVRNQLTARRCSRCTSMPRHASGRRKWPPPPSRGCSNPAG